MAQSARRVNSRSDLYKNRQMRYNYEDGNAVRKPEWVTPEEEWQEPVTRKQKQQRKAAGKTRQNQRARTANRTSAGRSARTQSVSAGYVVFLGIVCIVTVFFCIQFLQLKSELTTQSVRIASMESNLSQMQADNDAFYKKVMASVTMDEVRDAAINRLNMHYPSESQIRYYSTDENSYVRQYTNVP
ncbi:MAG: hypothetical protein IJ239_05015 [Eubacterium sp.]|nr:hypothetical protein [Eubacterium sp.]